MKDLKMKIYFIIYLLYLSGMTIKCATDFTIFPEDISNDLAQIIWKDVATTENILAAVQFGADANSSTVSKDARSNLAWNRVNNVIIFFIQ